MHLEQLWLKKCVPASCKHETDYKWHNDEEPSKSTVWNQTNGEHIDTHLHIVWSLYLPEPRVTITAVKTIYRLFYSFNVHFEIRLTLGQQNDNTEIKRIHVHFHYRCPSKLNTSQNLQLEGMASNRFEWTKHRRHTESCCWCWVEVCSLPAQN